MGDSTPTQQRQTVAGDDRRRTHRKERQEEPNAVTCCENLNVPYNLGSVISLQFNYLFIKSDSRSFEPFYHGYVF